MNDEALVIPVQPTAASSIFGSQIELARAYAIRLAEVAIERGLLGPRELPRLWSRHIVNSAVVAELIPADSTVADVGSGAGLPGIPLAIARPDLEVVLIEPSLRRSTFLQETVSELGLDRVSVLRARAEQIHAGTEFDVVTARAVAPLERLASWTLPLLRPAGRLLAIKGQSVSEELRESAASLAKMSAASWTVEEVGVGLVDPPTRVVVIRVGGDRGRAVRPGVNRRPSTTQSPRLRPRRKRT
jgi:16S rRNA (guanine527-N7)-methyltransferase